MFVSDFVCVATTFATIGLVLLLMRADAASTSRRRRWEEGAYDVRRSAANEAAAKVEPKSEPVKTTSVTRSNEEPAMSNAKASFFVLHDYLVSTGCAVHANEASSSLTVLVHSKAALMTVHAGVDEPRELAWVNVILPLVVPEKLRASAAETVVRVNESVLVGGFTLRMSDGFLSFRSTLPLAGSTLTLAQFNALWHASLGAAVMYHRAFARLVYGDDLSPAEVVAEVEMALDAGANE